MASRRTFIEAALFGGAISALASVSMNAQVGQNQIRRRVLVFDVSPRAAHARSPAQRGSRKAVASIIAAMIPPPVIQNAITADGVRIAYHTLGDGPRSSGCFLTTSII